MMDLVNDDDNFLAVAQPVIDGMQIETRKEALELVPVRLRQRFLEALEYRKQSLPMFPDPADTDIVIMTRRLADIMFPSTFSQSSSNELSVGVLKCLNYAFCNISFELDV